MPDLILSRPGRPGYISPVMEREVFEKACKLLSESGNRTLALYADWLKPPDYLAWAVEELTRRHLRATACFDLGDPVEPMSVFKEAGFHVRLGLNAEATSLDFTALNRMGEVELFVPFSSPAQDLSSLWTTVQAMPRIRRIRLGVGWNDYFSGPNPWPEAEKGLWAAAVENLVDELTARRLDIEMDCGLPLCIFSRRQLGRLAARRLFWPIAVCPTSLFINPLGEVQPCLRLAGPQAVNIREISSLIEVREAYEARLAAFRSFCRHGAELECRSLLTGACAGGCLEHALGEWRSSGGAAFTSSSR